MRAAIAKEVKGLMDASTFKIVLREEAPPDEIILPGRFVLAITLILFEFSGFRTRPSRTTTTYPRSLGKSCS